MAGIIYLLCFIASYKVKNSNKMTAFECGFSAIGAMSTSFSVHFFIMLVVFILFEMEIVLLVGCIYATSSYSFLIVILFVLLGIYLEYFLGKLS